VILILAAGGLLASAVQLVGMSQAGAFVGGGALLLGGLLVLVWGWLRRGGGLTVTKNLTLLGLAMRNAARNPGRSATTIGLMATASFLIVAMSSFRMAPSDRRTGGFDLLAESSASVFVDLNSVAGREEVLADQADLLAGSNVFGLRLRAGDDASCNNLYRPVQPRVIGVTPDFVEHFDRGDVPHFGWADSLAETDREQANPWRLLLDGQRDEEQAIPAVVDLNMATYSLRPPVPLGGLYTARFAGGRELTFRIVGMLDSSVLQGSLLVSEADFERHFPDVEGYRYFLIRSPTGKSDAVTRVLEERLGDQGFDAVPTERVLAQLLAVQNTYLSTFQSLGALGLLLGTFGLAAVQLRSVLERRSELALMRAAGFRHRRLARLVLSENILLLAAGLTIGAIAALLAVLPHKFLGETAIPVSLLRDLAIMLAVVFIVGVLASLASVRAALRAPILTTLRQE
jgi:hypothetical protein